MMIILQFIPGCMVGIEFLTEDDIVVLDLLIVRVMICYGDKSPPGFT